MLWFLPLLGICNLMRLLNLISAYALLSIQQAYNRKCGNSALHRLKNIKCCFVDPFLRLYCVNHTSQIESIKSQNFKRTLIYYSRFFEKILLNLCTFNRTTAIEININIFSKSWWIIISNGFCVAESYSKYKFVLIKLYINHSRDKIQQS